MFWEFYRTYSIDFCAKFCANKSRVSWSIFSRLTLSSSSEQLIYYKFWLLRLGWSMKLCFWSKKILISIAISSKNVKPKELVRLNNLCSQNITFTENLNPSLKRPYFTCTQCMINNKNLESYNFWLTYFFLRGTDP